ncbi:dihydroneopterin aldolase [Hydrogenimonas cancrithermarum]|uniref:Dihydroneopterin aldolase n=1 Tax=Hydrogenimonas cancrithermarum TaxID=2993563 RepID=A0ABN6WW74_9BACT|nr:dihydroneopterin aldolase [Hydrogenimonas cancrithermarum]BDY12557.1 dihydroneopterin aldolase [Hydrogenimonas cancrithermarum]
MTISIRSLHFQAIMGLLDFERTSPQCIEVDCEIAYGYQKEERRFLDYAEVASLIESTIKQEKFLLVEDALETLFGLLKAKFPQIETINITICKPDILPNCRVCVTDFRSYL